MAASQEFVNTYSTPRVNLGGGTEARDTAGGLGLDRAEVGVGLQPQVTKQTRDMLASYMLNTRGGVETTGFYS